MHFLYLFTHQAYGHSLAREALDMALATAAFDQKISLVFLQDGIYQLLSSKDASSIETKPHCGVISALPLYDIENIFYLATDRDDRCINEESLLAHATAISPSDLQALMASADRIQSF
ncbi:sulfurtransferase complex subunit TusC [Zhongshania sp.]|jgi:tRNA 2-thiouridine synthesizing protein C|uniref:sulfurtransferase complex subunit TusC n=1 Tax=Zhongshania sp. TaxID=1971902 RepID=UPI001B42D0AA|nr:sulfurtransferase complex subunit TusC [Zhongshania sp.]MBQ0759910.1 sulfurtransferase complex subunit TusC [Zhongshania sp.]MBQ0795666.1 sulfurtransferase complex subunit TusC [Zhongshania sp.]|tara:strand:- start:365722 stop:366075 length:354 start_codon:yes stop_codon:yes gene_type:complete